MTHCGQICGYKFLCVLATTVTRKTNDQGTRLVNIVRPVIVIPSWKSVISWMLTKTLRYLQWIKPEGSQEGTGYENDPGFSIRRFAVRR